MVAALGPGKFYGSSLPRPYIYTDVKFNGARVDPPTSIMDPLMTWAEEAHWSMGGLNLTRHRLQGRIEGNVDKLRAQREEQFKVSSENQKQQKHVNKKGSNDKDLNSNVVTPSPPPAPMVIKRRRVIGLVDEDDDDEGQQRGGKRGTVRKLEDDFERVAERTRSKRIEKADLVVNKGKITTKGKKKLVKGGIRVSPRLSKT